MNNVSHPARRLCHYPQARHGVYGFTLIELMIGLLISLIGTLAMLTAFALFEGQKRTTTSGNDAEQSGSFSIYELEREIRSAGSGLVQGKNYSIWGCPIKATTGGATVLPSPAAFPVPFAAFPQAIQAIPVLVSSGGATGPDTIAVIGGNPSQRVFEAGVTAATTASSLTMNNAIGVMQAGGDYMLSSPIAGNCVLGLLGASTTNTFPVIATTVPATGFVGALNIFDLGPVPTFSLYGVNTAVTPNVLVNYNMLSGATTTVADGIITIKALYGVDDGATTASIPGSGVVGDGVIDEWVQPTGATWGYTALMAGTTTAITNMSEIKAIRIAVVAQSELPERTNGSNPPPTSIPNLFADLPAGLQFTVTISSNYRYKVYDTTIPVRNAFVSKFF